MNYRVWTVEEVNFLKENWRKGVQYCAEHLNRSLFAISQKGNKIGLKRNASTWTQEEIAILEEYFGTRSIHSIAKKLGRSFGSVNQKADKLKLGDPTLSFDGITINQLAGALGVHYGTVMNWIKEYDLPARRKVFVKEMRVWVVSYQDFWKWAEAHKHALNFARVTPGILGAEPKWVPIKRRGDSENYAKKKKKMAWTQEEHNILLGMVKSQKYTYPEIAQRLQRSEAAIKRRLYDMKIKARPVRLPNVYWTPEQEELLVSMYEKGFGLNSIAKEVGRSSLAVRGKMEQMGYRFMQGIPYQNTVIRKVETH